MATQEKMSFAELFEASLKDIKMAPGDLIQATVVSIRPDRVILNAGLKSECSIPTEEFKDASGEITIKEGELIDVVIDAIDDAFGNTVLSRGKAKQRRAWAILEEKFASSEPVTGNVVSKVKGGFRVELAEGTVVAFLPGSLIGGRTDQTHLEGKTMDFKIIKFDQKRSNVVLSRRDFGSEGGAERQESLASLLEGQEIKGVVKNLTEYGAFVDLGGIDGLLHITDMSWKRVKHPSEVVTVGDEINVRILKIDRERNRVSLGIKQLGEDPWSDAQRRYPVNTRLTGRVSNITDYGAFVELEEGIEGLVHSSEMDWTNKNVNPGKVVQLGNEVEVMVLDIDGERRRISLGIKQCKSNPWKEFSETHKKGERIRGKIKSITDFGIFIGLPGDIDGLIHFSDISWNVTGEEAVKNYKKGDEVEAIILAIDPERERVSLGIKQLEHDPFNNFVEMTEKGSIVKGVVLEVDTKGVKIDLGDSIEGFVKASEVSKERSDDGRIELKIGEEIEAKYMGVDKKTRIINLSIKAKDAKEEADAIKEYSRKTEKEIGTATLGDLLKEKMEGKEGE